MEVKEKYLKSLEKIENLNIEKLLKSYKEEKKIGVRFNTKKIDINLLDKKNIQKTAEKLGISGQFLQILWCKSGFYYIGTEKLGKNIMHEIGTYYLQEPSAMSPVEFLNIEKYDKVLDLCASPGGKTTQIAEKITDGFVVANEIVPKRAKVLLENVERLGLDNVCILNHSPKELEKHFENYFDKILVDAPCSGEGMFRKNADASDEWNENLPKQCATRQFEILESAYKMLSQNGMLAYSTCTFSLEENEEVIDKFLSNHSDLSLVEIDHAKYGFENGNIVNNNLELKKTARLYPYNIDGEGHFFAIIKRTNIENFNGKYLKNNKKSQKNRQNIEIFNKFAKQYLNVTFDNFCSFGNFLYANCKTDLTNLKTLSAGLLLGEIRNNLFFPSNHLARFLKEKNFKNVIELDENETKKYIEGLEIECKASDGWKLLTYKGLPVAFGKCVLNRIKNHYPKNLRKKL